MHDGNVVAACLDSREAFDRVEQFVDKAEFTPMAAHWWGLVSEWYHGDPDAKFVDRPVLRERGIRTVNEKHRETMASWFDHLEPVGSPGNVVSELIAVKRHAVGNELAAAIGGDRDKLVELARDYVEILEAETLEKDTWIEAGDWDDIETLLSAEGRTKLLPLSLNNRAGGGAIPGHHIVIFGPTEIGKSLLAINMVAGFLRQSKRVLVVSNEDAASVWKHRVLCSLANKSAAEVREDRAGAVAHAESKGIRNLLVGNMDPGDVKQIERKVDEWNADIVVVDQLRNLNAVVGTRGGSITQKLDRVAQEFRSMLIRRQIIGVSLTQAHAGEHGKPQVWMSYDDVDSSRTGIPASADLLIAIGANEDMEAQGQRAISLCKNKLGGKKDGFIVQYDTERSRCR